MNIALRLIGIAALLGAAVACADPPPRGAANPGVSPSPGTQRNPNAPYYQGADPDFPRGGRGGGGRGP